MGPFSKWIVRNKLDEAANGLLQSIAKAVQANAHTDPFLNHIVSDQNEFQEFLMSAHYVLKTMPPEQREMIATGPQGMAMLIRRMVADYKSRSPEYTDRQAQQNYGQRWGNAQQQEYEPGMRAHPAHTPSGRKLLELAAAAIKKLGRDPKPYIDKVIALMQQQSQAKVDQWAKTISTPDEMLAKMSDWQKRRLL
jgi:hypothetical protein